METARAIRVYHAFLAALALTAYFLTHPRYVHAFVGYAVTAIIVFRALWSLKRDPLLSFSRFIPSFQGMTAKNFLNHPATGRTITLIVFLSLIGACATGIAMDKGRALGLGLERPVAAAQNPGEQGPHRRHERSELAEAHEFFANIFITFAVLHLAHGLAFRRLMAKFMLFMDKKKIEKPS